MAEGGDFSYEDKDLDYHIDHDDDDDQEVNRTGPCVPYAASTPYHGGEQHEFQTMMHEKAGLPDTSYEETPLLGAQAQMQNSWDALTRLFPRASATDLETSYSKTGRLQVKMSGFGKKTYPLFTKNKYTGKEQLNPGLTKEIKNSLGSSAGDIIAEDQDSIRDQSQRIAEAEEQIRQAEALAAEREKKAQEVQTLVEQNEEVQGRIDAHQDKHGSNLEIKSEINRLKLLKKIMKATLKKRTKN